MAPRPSVAALSGGAPQYALLAQELLRGIGAGDYPVGSLLPTEAELCRRYAVSRITARAAMRELQSRGLVSRRAGVGTRVEQAVAQERFVHVSNSVDAILQFTADARLHVVKQGMITLDRERAGALHCEPGQAMLESLGLRSKERQGKDGQAAFCLTRFYIPAMYSAVGPRMQGHRGSVMLLMERMFGLRLTEMQQVIEAAPLTTGDARLLGARPREAALVTRRWHLGEHGRLFIASVSLYPHERYSYALRMRREHGTPQADPRADT
jgi:DNA-binding GntR family transcriptional regulator